MYRKTEQEKMQNKTKKTTSYNCLENLQQDYFQLSFLATTTVTGILSLFIKFFELI